MQWAAMVRTLVCLPEYSRRGIKGVNFLVMTPSWWRHQMETFSAQLALCAGNSPVSVNSPHRGQWCGALMFSLICVWINGWVNNREASDLRRHRVQYDVIVMIPMCTQVLFCAQEGILLKKWASISNNKSRMCEQQVQFAAKNVQ